MTVADKQRVDRIFGPWLIVLLRPLAQLAGKLLGRDHSSAPRGEIVFIKLLGGGSLLIALPALLGVRRRYPNLSLTLVCGSPVAPFARRSEEHTSELQSPCNLVCRLLLEKKNKHNHIRTSLSAPPAHT